MRLERDVDDYEDAGTVEVSYTIGASESLDDFNRTYYHFLCMCTFHLKDELKDTLLDEN